MVGRADAPYRVRPYQVSGRTARTEAPATHETRASGVTGASRALSRDPRYPPRMPRLPRRAALVLFGLLTVTLVAACGGTAASFDPTGECTGDGSAPGAYPDLEAMVPTRFMDAAPGLLDSGRNCSDANLGSLSDAGISEVRFAGGTWTFGAERAAVLAVFTAPGLTASDLADLYLETARSANRTKITSATQPTIEGRAGRRLDTMTGSRTQTVVVWPAATPDTVNVVITNDLPDARIQEAIDAFGEG